MFCDSSDLLIDDTEIEVAVKSRSFKAQQLLTKQVTSTENGHKTDKQDEDTERGKYIEGLECAEGVEIQKL